MILFAHVLYTTNHCCCCLSPLQKKHNLVQETIVQISLYILFSVAWEGEQLDDMSTAVIVVADFSFVTLLYILFSVAWEGEQLDDMSTAVIVVADFSFVTLTTVKNRESVVTTRCWSPMKIRKNK